MSDAEPAQDAMEEFRGPDLEQWVRDREILPLLKRGAEFGLKHATTFLALSALVLYAAGLFRTLAQLRAENVQTLRGLPLAPLQTYFVAGLAMAFDPAGLAFVLSLVVMGALPLVAWRYRARIAEMLRTDDEDDSPDVTEAGIDISHRSVQRRVTEWVFGAASVLVTLAMLLALLFGFLFTPTNIWAPYVLVGLPFVPLIAFVALKMIPQDVSTWTPFHARLAALSAAAAAALFVLAPGYFNPPPLDEVTIRGVNGKYTHGKLLTQSNGLTYLVGHRGQLPGDASIIVIPATRIARIEVTSGSPRYFRSIAESFGLRLWRLEIANGSRHIRRL